MTTNIQQYPGEALCQVERTDSIMDTLISKKKSLENRLNDVNEAIKALEANPEFVKCFNLVAKTR